MSEQRLFAGFWRDGAVVKPELRHGDNDRYILVMVKHDNRYEKFRVDGGAWSAVYWLDTTTPTELTPQEAFELLRVISPSTKRIKPLHISEWIKAEPFKPMINWGSTTEYPPLEKWRVPTDSDKGKKCRCWDDVGGFRDEGRFVAIFDDGFLTTSSRGFMIWDNCEVIED
jgi:hypothetical protein